MPRGGADLRTRVLELRGQAPEAVKSISFSLDKIGDVHIETDDIAGRPADIQSMAWARRSCIVERAADWPPSSSNAE